MNTAAPDPSAAPMFHGDDGSEWITARRAEFEQWFVTNSFDYASHPIGSRLCDLQWRAWNAALSAPAAAVGGAIAVLDTIRARFEALPTDKPLTRAEITAAEYAILRRDIATPAAPVGGFVVDIPEAFKAHPSSTNGGMGYDKTGNWEIQIQPGHKIICDERFADGWNRCRGHVIAASPAAQSSAKDGVRVDSFPNWNEHLRDNNALDYQHDFRLFKVAESYAVKAVEATTEAGLVDGENHE